MAIPLAALASAPLPIATLSPPLALASLPTAIWVSFGAGLAAITGATLAQVITPVAISIANIFFVEQLLLP